MRKRLALLTPMEAAAILRISKTTMYRWIQDNRVPYFRLPSGDIRINEDELHEWLAKRHSRAVGRN